MTRRLPEAIKEVRCDETGEEEHRVAGNRGGSRASDCRRSYHGVCAPRVDRFDRGGRGRVVDAPRPGRARRPRIRPESRVAPRPGQAQGAAARATRAGGRATRVRGDRGDADRQGGDQSRVRRGRDGPGIRLPGRPRAGARGHVVRGARLPPGRVPLGQVAARRGRARGARLRACTRTPRRSTQESGR